MGVVRSGHYASPLCNASERQQQRTALDERVAKALGARKGRSGSARLYLDVKAFGGQCNRKSVAVLMRREHLEELSCTVIGEASIAQRLVKN
jgi:hypothetical protein